MKGTTGLRENIRNFPLTGEGCATLDSVHSEPMRLPDQMDARTDGGSVRSQCPSTAGEPSLGRERQKLLQTPIVKKTVAHPCHGGDDYFRGFSRMLIYAS